MATFLTPEDLEPFATIPEPKASVMIDDATAMAVLAAPCLAEPSLTEAQTAAVRAILRGAIIRWNEAGSGALQSETVGPFGQTLDTRQQRRGMFWPSEIAQLRDICGGSKSGGAFSLDTSPVYGQQHADICSLRFGAAYCSCGAILTGAGPLYEV